VQGSGPSQQTSGEASKEDASLIGQALNNSISSFNPDLMFEQLVKDYKLAKHIFGEKLIREITGIAAEELDRNINLPEYREHMRQKINKRVEQLRKKKLLDKKNSITEKAIALAARQMYMEELDKLQARGLGEKELEKRSTMGYSHGIKQYSRGDRYRDISVSRTVRSAIRRGHSRIETGDLRVNERKSRGKIYIVFALDASGSMRGEKLEACKKAGMALAYKATEAKDHVGLIVFGPKVEKRIEPTRDFTSLIEEIASIRAHSETDISAALNEAAGIFPGGDITRHMVLITDAMPTKGKTPEEDTLKAASMARSTGITISIVGINLAENGEKIARKITDIGQGKFYKMKSADDVDIIVLQDYESLGE